MSDIVKICDGRKKINNDLQKTIVMIVHRELLKIKCIDTL